MNNFKNDLGEVQEGDPKYLAPEILQNSKNISCAADIFSLGLTILELATDLDLPRSGDLWHELRTGHIPPNLIRNLSPDLIELILRMIEPDHLKRESVYKLINKTPKVRHLILAKEKSLFYYLYSLYNQWNSFILSIWYLAVRPYHCLKKKLTYQSLNELNYFETCSINENVHHASTPKKLEMPKTPQVLINSQQCDVTAGWIFYLKKSTFEICICLPSIVTILLEIDYRNNHSFNDTLSTNNSYGKALDDSSSFGDLSGFSNHNK